MNLYPFYEVANNAKKHVDQGHTVHQQFNCEKCGRKQTMAEANKFFTEGKCEECEHITNIRKAGCNFMAIMNASTFAGSFRK